MLEVLEMLGVAALPWLCAGFMIGAAVLSERGDR